MSGCYDSLCYFWEGCYPNHLKQSIFQIEYKLAEIQKHNIDLEYKYEMLLSKINENSNKIIKIDKKQTHLESNLFMEEFQEI